MPVKSILKVSESEGKKINIFLSEKNTQGVSEKLIKFCKLNQFSF